MRAEKLVGLLDQILVVVPHFLRRIQRGGAVGGDIHLGGRSMRQGHYFQEFSGDDRRVDQRGERSCGELNLIAALFRNRQGRSELPALRKFQAGREVDVVGFPSLGIEQDLVPTDDRHLGSGGRTGGESAFKSCGRKKIEFGVHFRCACRDFHVNGERSEQV